MWEYDGISRVAAGYSTTTGDHWHQHDALKLFEVDIHDLWG